MRFLAAFHWLIATQVAISQNTWTYLGAPSQRLSRLLDLEEHIGGHLAINFEYNASDIPRASTTLLGLNSQGEPFQARRLWNADASVSGTALVTIEPNLLYMVFGAIENDMDSGHYFTHLIDNSLIAVDSTEYHVSNLYRPFVDNVLHASDGTLLLGGCGYSNTAFLPNSMTLLRIDQTGDSLDSYTYGSNDLLIPRDILEFAPDSFLVATAGVPDFGFQDWAWASYLKFDGDLEPQGGFLSRAYDGSAAQLNFDNNIGDNLHLERLPSGDIIVCGKPVGGEQRTIVVKLTQQGEWRGFFRPVSEYPVDHPAALGAIAISGDEILIASMENYFEGQMVLTPFLPDHPNQIKVYKLDTALNLLCANVVDGFRENAYYWADRIKSTSDGGYIICGARFDLNVPNARMVGWAQKFGPEECYVGVAEHAAELDHSAFPNPGTDRLTVSMNGKIITGSFILTDTNGKQMATVPLFQNSATLDTRALASGIYAYRIIDQTGYYHASGLWVKSDN